LDQVQRPAVIDDLEHIPTNPAAGLVKHTRWALLKDTDSIHARLR
jgi:hypothetical protein